MKWRIFLFSVLAIAFLFKLSGKAYASSDWAGIPFSSFSDTSYDPTVSPRLNCDTRKGKSPSILPPVYYLADGSVDLARTTITYRDSGKICVKATESSYSSYLSNYYSAGIDSPTIPTLANDYGAIWLPGTGKTAVVLTNSNTNYGVRNISINYNFTNISSLKNHSGELTMTPRSMAPLLKNINGTNTDIDYFTSSSNGKFLIMHLYGGQLVRLDLSTREMTPFGSGYVGYGSTLNTAISNDGRYAFVSEGPFVKIYDLQGCTEKYAENTWPAYFYGKQSFDGCTFVSQDLRNYKPYFPGDLRITEVRFDDDGKRLVFDVMWRNAANMDGYFYRVTLKSSSYEEPRGYLAMGDSFASGEGDNDERYYEDPTNDHDNGDGTENLCHLSARSYSYQIAKSLGLKDQKQTPTIDGLFHSVACSGAKTKDITFTLFESDSQYSFIDNTLLAFWQPGYDKQTDYLSEKIINDVLARKSFNPSAITISIGGNDAGFKDRLVYCALPTKCAPADSNNMAVRSAIALEMANVKPKLVKTYNKIKESAPESRIYVIGYPQFFSGAGSCGLNAKGFDMDERTFIRESVSYFNQVISSAATEAGVEYVNAEDILEGHNLCSSSSKDEMRVNGLTLGDDLPNLELKGISLSIVGNESFHPNENAQSYFTSRIMQSTASLSKLMPNPVKTATPAPSPYFGPIAQQTISALNSGLADLGNIQELHEIINSLEKDKVIIDLSNLAPNKLFRFIIHSNPINLGEATSDAEGKLHIELNIPTSVESGYHEIHMNGEDISGKKIDYYQPVYLASRAPNDTDGDGILNDQDKCLFVEQANQDYDKDGIDDGCDGFIAEPPKDTTPPTVTGAASEQPNANGWYNHDVSINWQSVDTGYHEGEPTQPASTTADQEGEHAYTSGQSCDSANNCATGSQTIKIDKTAPTITANTDRQANANGWFNGPVTVNFECSDSLSSIESCPTPITVSEENANHIITGTALDKAGNSSTVNLYLKIDLSVPTINYSLSNQPNAAGWYNNDVTVSFNCEDSLSGVVECPAPFLVSGGNQTILRDVSDLAGNKASLSVDIKQDKLAPIVTLAMSSQANSLGWFNQPVTLTPTCSDDLSGIKICPEPVIVSTDSLANLLEFSAEDNAGNHSSIQTIIKLDTTKPKITYLASPSPNSSGWHNTSYVVSFTCSDELSGIATCPSSQTVSTNDQITATATDNAGNSTSLVVQPKIDTSAPSIQPLLGSTANVNGWFNVPVTISFNCSDDLSGIGTCQSPITVGAEGSILVGGTASDLAGNSASVNVLVKLDYTAPTLTPIYSIQPNSSGVFSGPVTVSFACTDILSGIAVCPAPITVSTTGNTSISATAKDYAGNSYAWTKTITIQSPQTSCTVQLVLQGKCNPKELTQCKNGSWPKAVCNALGIWFELLIKLYGLYKP